MPDWIAVVLRTLGAIIILFVLTRLLGKRQVSTLSPFEYITGITIGGLAASIPSKTDGTWHLGIVSLIVWVSVAIGMEFLQLKSKKIREWIDGKTTVLIKDGKVLEENLKKERITIDELMAQLRKRSIFHISDIKIAVIEPDGNINAFVYKELQPITPKMLGLKVTKEEIPYVVIADGIILDEELAKRGLTREWLQAELKKKSIASEHVFLGQVDSEGQLYVDCYDDQHQVQQPQEKAKLLTTLEKCKADLDIFSLSTKDQQAKKLYERYSRQLQQMIEETNH
ncbi:DUF421 domain-containing protein [Laceyella putida]|uniref:DUF421 domain-containing protein n=1 Tax=Laceyella putida TaxID=110101 RepID=A0ABW2RJ79_9BACL